MSAKGFVETSDTQFAALCAYLYGFESLQSVDVEVGLVFKFEGIPSEDFKILQEEWTADKSTVLARSFSTMLLRLFDVVRDARRSEYRQWTPQLASWGSRERR